MVPALPSDKKFGLLFALIFSLIGIYNLYKSGPWPTATALFIVATSFLVAALAAPNVLAPLNRAWFALGLLLGKVVSPVVLGAMFFLLITPVAVLSRWFGRDELRLRKRNVTSYWVRRDAIGLKAESFKNQF